MNHETFLKLKDHISELSIKLITSHVEDMSSAQIEKCFFKIAYPEDIVKFIKGHADVISFSGGLTLYNVFGDWQIVSQKID